MCATTNPPPKNHHNSHHIYYSHIPHCVDGSDEGDVLLVVTRSIIMASFSTADGAIMSKAVGPYLGPPYDGRGVEPDVMRQIEEAELALQFGRMVTSAASGHQEALRKRPGDLPLHYKVWQLLIATYREGEAQASYVATCSSICDPTVAAYHACVKTSAALGHARMPLFVGGKGGSHGGGGGDDGTAATVATASTTTTTTTTTTATPTLAASHTIEIPQPETPDSLAAHVAAAPSRPFIAFNPAIVKLPRSRRMLPFGGRRTTSGRSRYLVFFRYSNVTLSLTPT